MAGKKASDVIMPSLFADRSDYERWRQNREAEKARRGGNLAKDMIKTSITSGVELAQMGIKSRMHGGEAADSIGRDNNRKRVEVTSRESFYADEMEDYKKAQSGGFEF